MISVNVYIFAAICIAFGALGGSFMSWLIIPHGRIHVTVLPADDELLSDERIHDIIPSRRSDGA